MQWKHGSKNYQIILLAKLDLAVLQVFLLRWIHFACGVILYGLNEFGMNILHVTGCLVLDVGRDQDRFTGTVALRVRHKIR